MNKTFKILELVWLAVGCVGVIMCIYFIITGSRQDAVYFLVFSIASGLMYAVRKRQRIKFEAAQKSKGQNK